MITPTWSTRRWEIPSTSLKSRPPSSFLSGPTPFNHQQDPSVFHVQQPVFPAGHLQGALPPQVFKSHSSHVIKESWSSRIVTYCTENCALAPLLSNKVKFLNHNSGFLCRSDAIMRKTSDSPFPLRCRGLILLETYTTLSREEFRDK